MIGYLLVLGMVTIALVAVVTSVVTMAPEPRAVRRQPGRAPVWVALGASDATGEGTADPARDNWIAQLAAALPPDVVVHNLAVGGSTLAEARQVQLPQALALAPDVVSLWLAVNDFVAGIALDRYEHDLADMLAMLDGADCRVVVGNLPDLSRLPMLAPDADHAALLHEAIERWNAAIARIANAYQAQLVDLHEGVITVEHLSADGFHPNVLGHALLATRFRPAIEAALTEVNTSGAARLSSDE